MAFSTTSRSFTNLATAASNDPSRNNSNPSSAALTSTLGNGAGPWGNNASSIWGNGSSVVNPFPSRAVTRDSSRSRDMKSTSSAESSADTDDGKKASAPLFPSSDSDAWSFPHGRGDSAIRLSTQQPRTSTTSGFPPSLSTGAQNISPTTSRPPTINLTNTSFSHQRPSFNPSTYSAGSFTADPPTVYPKYKDRPPPHSYYATDSAISPTSTDLSPTSERKPWAVQSRDPTSVTTSRDPSRPPPSSHSDRRPSYSLTEYSRQSQLQTPISTRAGSISSQRSGLNCRPNTGNSADYLESHFAQFGLGHDEQPSYSRNYSAGFAPGQNGFTAGQNGFAPGHNDFTVGQSGIPAVQNGSSRHSRDDNVQEIDRFSHSHPSIDTFDGSHQNGHGNGTLINTSFDPLRFRASMLSDFTPAQTSFANGMPRSRSHDLTNPSKPTALWQGGISDDTVGLARRSPTMPAQQQQQQQQQQLMLDPRTMMLMKSPYALYSPYDISNSMAIGGMSPYANYYHMGLPGLESGVMAPDFVTDGVQSAKLYEFKIAPKGRRYELKDIFDHIAEFAGDQHGSRFIQNKLETANSDDKECVFREIEPNAIQLMTDVFGNYVIQKFFDHGHQEHKKVLANKMRGQVLNLSLQMYGCRVVQKALEHVLIEQQAALVAELEHHVLKCVKDQNGNHVIQKAIERCPSDTIGFVYQAFVGQVHSLSTHTYGCRVIQRCLERQDWFPAKRLILAELHESMPKGMVADQYGNYVVQHVIQKCGPADRQHALAIVMAGLEDYSKHKYASNVVEKCIEYSDDTWRRDVVNLLVSSDPRRAEGESILVGLIKDSFGNYVIQKLLDRLAPQDYMCFHQHLQPAMAYAKRTGCGKSVVSIEKKMHRFPYQQQLPPPSQSQQSLHPHPQQQLPHLHQNPAYQLSIPPSAFTSNYGSLANTPPSLTSDNQSLQSSTIQSVNGDAVEGATSMSRKGSEPSNDGTILR